jgi:hypothetical protein
MKLKPIINFSSKNKEIGAMMRKFPSPRELI